MKYLAAALGTLCLAAHAGPPQQRPQVDLRELVQQQYHQRVDGTSRASRQREAAPRELSPLQRAELRRQLSEFARPPRRR